MDILLIEITFVCLPPKLESNGIIHEFTVTYCFEDCSQTHSKKLKTQEKKGTIKNNLASGKIKQK